MIKTKEKPCKGNGKASGFGCGNPSSKRKYGLCMDGNRCYQNFLLNSDPGKEILSKNRIGSSKKVKKEKVKEANQKKKEIINYAGKLQSKVQEIARLIDLGHKCLARNKMALQYDGGHVFGKGSHTECKYNLHNIFAQDSKSNQSTTEDQLMTEGVRREFGNDYFLFIEGLKNKPIIKHSKQDIERFYRKACAVSNRLKKAGEVYSMDQRIELRNKINLEIGFYPEEYCLFK